MDLQGGRSYNVHHLDLENRFVSIAASEILMVDIVRPYI